MVSHGLPQSLRLASFLAVMEGGARAARGGESRGPFGSRSGSHARRDVGRLARSRGALPPGRGNEEVRAACLFSESPCPARRRSANPSAFAAGRRNRREVLAPDANRARPEARLLSVWRACGAEPGCACLRRSRLRRDGFFSGGSGSAASASELCIRRRNILAVCAAGGYYVGNARVWRVMLNIEGEAHAEL